MRRTTILIFLLGMLAALVAARAALPEAIVPAMAEDYGYNILSLALPTVKETAGSAMIAEMNAYFLSREATEKNAWTGVLRGKNLVLVCADAWTPDPNDRRANPSLTRLAAGSAAIPQVWRPDWYQGDDGSLFAVLSGLTPTRAGDESALRYAAEQDIYLPFALPRCFAREGYACAAFLRDGTLSGAAGALGFDTVSFGKSAEDAAREVVAALDCDTPVFAFCQWDGSGEEALAFLLGSLEEQHRSDTALCLLAADADAGRAQLYLWGAGLSGAASDVPCSELDIPPTLLNLWVRVRLPVPVRAGHLRPDRRSRAARRRDAARHARRQRLLRLGHGRRPVRSRRGRVPPRRERAAPRRTGRLYPHRMFAQLPALCLRSPRPGEQLLPTRF